MSIKVDGSNVTTVMVNNEACNLVKIGSEGVFLKPKPYTHSFGLVNKTGSITKCGITNLYEFNKDYYSGYGDLTENFVVGAGLTFTTIGTIWYDHFDIDIVIDMGDCIYSEDNSSHTCQIVLSNHTDSVTRTQSISWFLDGDRKLTKDVTNASRAEYQFGIYLNSDFTAIAYDNKSPFTSGYFYNESNNIHTSKIKFNKNMSDDDLKSRKVYIKVSGLEDDKLEKAELTLYTIKQINMPH